MLTEGDENDNGEEGYYDVNNDNYYVSFHSDI